MKSSFRLLINWCHYTSINTFIFSPSSHVYISFSVGAINYIHVNYRNLMMFSRFMKWNKRSIKYKKQREKCERTKWKGTEKKLRKLCVASLMNYWCINHYITADIFSNALMDWKALNHTNTFACKSQSMHSGHLTSPHSWFYFTLHFFFFFVRMKQIFAISLSAFYYHHLYC